MDDPSASDSSSSPGRSEPTEPRPIHVMSETAQLYFNRELSLLEFNRRVLELSRDPDVPLLERLRFLSISTSNLDEFFEIRVSGLKQQIAYDVGLSKPDRLRPEKVFALVAEYAHELVAAQYGVLENEILPALEQEGIHLSDASEWTPEQAAWAKDYFESKVRPVLTPIGLDPAHPFPRTINKSLNFVVSLKGKDAFGRTSRVAVVQAPRILPRLIEVPVKIASARHDFVLLSSIIHAHVAELFPGMKVRGCYQFRVTRNSDLWVDEEEVEDLMKALEGKLLARPYAAPVRLECDHECPEDVERFLLDQFELGPDDSYRVSGPVNLNRLQSLYDLVDDPRLKFPPFVPSVPTELTGDLGIFDAIKRGDMLLHHPYQSILPVVELLREASQDPDVLAIKQTVYRTGTESPLADALIEAARAGKEVTAVVELRARFDEANNIDLATRLQEAGAKVVYGIVGYKAHSKMLLVVRQEGDKLRRYCHLGTGNYHTGTSRAYTDFGILTCDPEVGQDVHDLFQQLTGLGKVSRARRLLQSPFTLHPAMIERIRAETEAAKAGRKSRIIIKMNALIEEQVIQAMYEASNAGVQIDLIVRGICCLRPGVPGLSENIRVRSVLGRFLEHSRIFYFYADGKEVVYCSSADWMPRNFFRRVETCFPVTDRKLRRRVIEEGLEPYLEDDTRTWELRADGVYERVRSTGRLPMNAQQTLLARLSEDPGSPPPDDEMTPFRGSQSLSKHDDDGQRTA